MPGAEATVQMDYDGTEYEASASDLSFTMETILPCSPYALREALHGEGLITDEQMELPIEVSVLLIMVAHNKRERANYGDFNLVSRLKSAIA